MVSCTTGTRPLGAWTGCGLCGSIPDCSSNRVGPLVPLFGLADCLRFAIEFESSCSAMAIIGWLIWPEVVWPLMGSHWKTRLYSAFAACDLILWLYSLLSYDGCSSMAISIVLLSSKITSLWHVTFFVAGFQRQYILDLS